jgi:hypothetical protein
VYFVRDRRKDTKHAEKKNAITNVSSVQDVKRQRRVGRFARGVHDYVGDTRRDGVRLNAVDDGYITIFYNAAST